MDNSLMNYIGIFVALAIMLGIGSLILGSATTDCTSITGYTSGEVTTVTITAAGNYSSAPTAAFSGGGGSVQATGTVSSGAIAGGFEVLAVTILTPGEDYTSAPTIAFTGGTVNTTATATAAIGADGEQTGWALQCVRNNTQSQAGYNLLIITLIVLAAVVVLVVVRMLS